MSRAVCAPSASGRHARGTCGSSRRTTAVASALGARRPPGRRPATTASALGSLSAGPASPPGPAPARRPKRGGRPRLAGSWRRRVGVARSRGCGRRPPSRPGGRGRPGAGRAGLRPVRGTAPRVRRAGGRLPDPLDAAHEHHGATLEGLAGTLGQGILQLLGQLRREVLGRPGVVRSSRAVTTARGSAAACPRSVRPAFVWMRCRSSLYRMPAPPWCGCRAGLACPRRPRRPATSPSLAATRARGWRTRARSATRPSATGSPRNGPPGARPSLSSTRAGAASLASRRPTTRCMPAPRKAISSSTAAACVA